MADERDSIYYCYLMGSDIGCKKLKRASPIFVPLFANRANGEFADNLEFYL